MTGVITRVSSSVLLLISAESRRINKDLKGAEVQRYHGGETSSDALAIHSGLLTPARQVPCLPSSACNTLSFSRSAPPMTRGVPSDQSQGCLVSSHRYNECHCVRVTLFPALISTLFYRLSIADISSVWMRNMSKLETAR